MRAEPVNEPAAVKSGFVVLRQNLIHPKLKRFPTHECLKTTCKLNRESSTGAQIRWNRGRCTGSLRRETGSAFHIYIKDGGNPARFPQHEVGIRQPDRSDGAARPAVAESRYDRKPHRKFCWPVFASRGQDACGLRGGASSLPGSAGRLTGLCALCTRAALAWFPTFGDGRTQVQKANPGQPRTLQSPYANGRSSRRR